MPAESTGQRLTSLTDCGGCAAKLGADLLHDLLGPLRDSVPSPPALLAGLDHPDDAAIYALDDHTAIVGTVDFFPPIVDDPYTYGAIAAANAVSDVYAMGGRVLFALNIAAMPPTLNKATIRAIFAGGADTVGRGGGVVAGGHTLNDSEPKYGLAVVGIADPRRLLLKSAARPGDRLLLTKPLGTGLLISGLRGGFIEVSELDQAIASMLRLNDAASRVLVDSGVLAATDVTGFGLLGHALEMSRASGVGLRIDAAALPLLDGVRALAPVVRTAGSGHNWRFVRNDLRQPKPEHADLIAAALDPQTSGGLLAAVPRVLAETVEAELSARSEPRWWIGDVVAGNGITLD